MQVLLNRGLMTKLKFLVLGIKIIIILLGLKHELYATWAWSFEVPYDSKKLVSGS